MTKFPHSLPTLPSEATDRPDAGVPRPASGPHSDDPVRETDSAGDFKRVIPASDLQELIGGDTDAGGSSRPTPSRTMSMTPLEAREMNGLKGFGFTVNFGDPS